MDTLFYNGTISTLDDRGSMSEAVGIENGLICFVGTNEEAKNFYAKEKIDLGGKLLLPGFVDGHMHLLSYAFVESSVKLFECRSVEETIKKTEEYLASNEGNLKWLYCRGWNEEKFTYKRYPTRQELDNISLDIPIIFVRVCGHVAVCNTHALNKIKTLPAYKELAEEMNLETGLIKEGAVQLYYSILEKPSQDYVEDLIKLSMKNLNAEGITGCQCDDFSSIPGADWELVVNSYRSLQNKNEMTVRVYEQCLFERIDGFKEFLDKGYRTGNGGAFFRIGPLKLLQDGSLGAKTAALNQPYENSDNMGIAIFSQSELDEIIILAHENNMQVAVHCIGDRAMNMTIDSIKKANKKNYKENCRHGIVHAQITDENILKEMGKNSIIAYIQPVFIDLDMDMVEKRIGSKRMDKIYAWNSMEKYNIMRIGGSDAPVVSFNVMENIYFAVTRKNINGKPDKGWLPEEKITVQEAVKMFTKYPAYSSFSENENGTVEPGKRADFVILSENIYQLDPDAIKDVKVNKTVVNGKIVYTS